MFTLSEMQNICERCLDEMNALLDTLNITRPAWNSEDISSFNRKLDEDINDKICEVMKSESIFDGYTKILKAASIPYNYSETQNNLLQKIIDDKEKVRAAFAELENIPKRPDYATSYEVIFYEREEELKNILSSIGQIAKAAVNSDENILLKVIKSLLGKINTPEKEDLQKKVSNFFTMIGNISQSSDKYYVIKQTAHKTNKTGDDFLRLIEKNEGGFFHITYKQKKLPKQDLPSFQLSCNELQNVFEVLDKLYDVVSKM